MASVCGGVRDCDRAVSEGDVVLAGALCAPLPLGQSGRCTELERRRALAAVRLEALRDEVTGEPS